MRSFMPDDTLIVSNGRLPIKAQTRTFVPIPASVESTFAPDSSGCAMDRAPRRDRYRSEQLRARRSGVEIFGNGRVKAGAPATADGAVVPPFLTVVDPAVLQLLGLSARDAASLQSLGAIAVRTPSKNAHTVPIEVGAAPARAITAAVAQDPVRATGDGDGYFLTAAKAQELGLAVVDAGVIIHNPKPLDQVQRASVDVISQSLFAQGPSTTLTTIAWSGPGNGTVSTAEVRQNRAGSGRVHRVDRVGDVARIVGGGDARRARHPRVARRAGRRPCVRSRRGRPVCSPARARSSRSRPGSIPVAVVFVAIVKPGEVAHISFPSATVLELLVLRTAPRGRRGVRRSAIAQAVRPTRMSTFATD